MRLVTPIPLRTKEEPSPHCRASKRCQHQAFGSANLGYGAELGYISIPELLAAGAELDLHFEPKPLEEIEKANA